MEIMQGICKATLASHLEDGRVQCKVCPRGCKLKQGQKGFCGTRQNIDGELYSLVYGKAVRVAQEYMETEGVFHFAPGAPILSIGNMGCNLHCKFCQNWETSQMAHIDMNEYEYYSPRDIVELALNKNIKVLSWTYNDPVVWHEFVMDTAKLARENGLLNLYKSAFYLSLEAVQQLCEVIDIFSISLKSIRDGFYTTHASATLPPIFEAIKYVYKSGIHLELSNLMVTDLNDTEADARMIVKWHLENTSADVPLHFVRFHPAYKYKDVPRTPVDRLVRARQIALEMGVKYCYIGNVYDDDSGNTFCPECRALLIRRYDINTQVVGLTDEDVCKNCGCKIPIKVKPFQQVMTKPRDERYRIQSKEVYRWSDEINRLHAEVTNPLDEETDVSVSRLGAAQTIGTGGAQTTRILPNETYRFIISKSAPEETGVVICYSPFVKVRISELLDRAHLPTSWKSGKKKFDTSNGSLKANLTDFLSGERGVSPTLAKNISFPLYSKIKGLPILKYLKKLEKSQWYEDERIKDMQFEKLKLLLSHCETNVPYYQQLFKENHFSVNDLRSIDDFYKLPILEKSDVINHNDALRSPGKLKLHFKAKTSGSTGFPLNFVNDYRSVSYSIAARMRAIKWWGIEHGTREAHFWGRGLSKPPGLRLRIGDFLIRNKMILTTLDLSEDRMFEHYRRLIKFRPGVIYGNPSAIYIFARFVREHDLDLSEIKPELVISTTEVLHDFQREFIAAVFGCPVINEYGGAETGIIAYECPEHSLHIAAENLMIEVIKDGKPCAPGEFGEIIVTNLNNYIMPFIRYRLGDVGQFRAGQCACGRRLPMLELMIGRDCDTIVLEDRELPGAVLFGCLGKELMSLVNGGLETYKVYQKEIDRFVFQAVMRAKGLEPLLEDQAKKVFAELLGTKVSVQFEYVDSIPRESTGKLRYFVSEVMK